MEGLLVLGFILLLITLVGHGIWVFLRWVFRQLAGNADTKPQPQTLGLSRCLNCNSTLSATTIFCGKCGTRKPFGIIAELLKDLAATERQLDRFRRAGAIEDDLYEALKHRIQAERIKLTSREPAAPVTSPPIVSQSATVMQQPASVTEPALDETPATAAPPSVVIVSEAGATSSVVIDLEDERAVHAEESVFASQAQIALPSPARQTASPRPSPPASGPRKSFSEMLAAFMEQSNIRWGEIIGGLLIIGCSTALVVSLWAQISRIPALKFLIFTTVTAALFGVGLYTEHRWKLPTTSRGILTIATLLVPLNFLAIAAVSGGTVSQGALVIGSELIAPALFLCLVYFAGRVITPSWPHLLAAGVLGSSVGQLLIRHFAAADNSPGLLLALGAFPVACYVAAAAWMLWIALADSEIDESETVAIFITLGALTFAALLPFGLLLYRSGPVSMTMMYLAPLVTLGGVPMLASGTLLWKRVRAKELRASRTAGTSIAIMGTVIVMSGMILAWPNPASIVPAALLNFAVLTALAVLLDLSFAHFLAAICFSLAYVVLFHVLAGHIAWQNLRVVSLLDVTTSAGSGQALAGLFVLFVVTSEWLIRKRRKSDSVSYLISACTVAIVSLLYLTEYGFNLPGDPHGLRFFYLLYAVGAFWLARRNVLPVFGWIGSALLLVSLFHVLGPWLDTSFPWQTSILLHAGACAIIAIVASRYCEFTKRALVKPLNSSALIASFAALLCLLQANQWETTVMQAQRVFWIAAIWFLLLWLNRDRRLFTVFQIALTGSLVLAIKAALQQYDWYTYLPHAFLHPTALQIQGTALLLLSLVWVGARFGVKRIRERSAAEANGGQYGTPAGLPRREEASEHWRDAAWRLLDTNVAFDRFVAWVVLVGFVLLAVYGAFPGVQQELSTRGGDTPVWNVAGFPHQYALGLGSWILLGLLVIALLANLWERRRAIYFFGAVAALATVCPLLAGSWETQIATASAWRWLAAMFLVFASLPLWFRERAWGRVRSFGWPESNLTLDEYARHTRILLLAATLIPLLLLTVYPALRAIYYMPVHGPSAGIFYALDETVSYSVPLVIAGLVLVAYALRERLVTYAFSGGLFFSATVTMAYLLSVVSVHGNMDRVVLVRVLQLNAIAAALYAILWLSAQPRWARRLTEELARRAERLLKLQIAIAIAANALVIVPVGLRLAAQPGWAGIGTFAAGSLTAWLAFGFTTAAGLWFAIGYRRTISPLGVCAFLLGAGCLAAFTAAPLNPAEWSGFHTLMIAAAIAAWLMCLARSLPSLVERRALGFISDLFARFGKPRFTASWPQDTSLLATVVGALTVVLALRGVFGDPTGSWWSIWVLLAMSALGAALNWQTLHRAYLYSAQALITAALTVWWLAAFKPWPEPTEFIEAHIVALTLPSILWLLFELRARRLKSSDAGTMLSFHHVAALLSLLTMGSVVFVELVCDTLEIPARPHSLWIAWLALVSLAALMTACLWDRQAKYAVAGLYLVGLVKAGSVLHEVHLPPHYLAWAVMIVMAAHTLGTSLIWHWRRPFIKWAARLKIPARLDPAATELQWLVVFNGLLIAAVICFAFGIDLQFSEWSLRMTAALAVAVQALSFGLMAEGKARPRWQRDAFVMFAVGAVFFGWAWLVPGVTGTWLNRAVILMVEMFAMVALFGLELDKAIKREPEWTTAIRDCVPWLAGIGSIALIFVLCTEVFYQIEFGAVRIKPLALVTIAATLAGASVISVLFALSPKHDPLDLPEHRRRNYVYVAEVMLALLFMHIRLTMPWLFTGFFERYWPLVVVAIAYLGIAVSEMLRRRGVLVLAHPIERTGVFLPLLPVLGFWLTEPQVDYSLLLFIVGALYGLLSILRRSFVFGIFAALAGNGGLWYLWHRTEDYGFLQHPQLWLIPAACSVLIAAYLNREDFSEDQMIGIRYLALIVIYVSSTADIFINGVARSPWLPMILAALSLVGVFGGIMLRIRAFLLLGSVFLLLAITTMIYYASANFGWTWLWYVAGIVTGAMIIFTFALFEKKRDEMLRVVEGLKDWQQ